MEIQKIKIKSDYQLADLIHDIEKGFLRIPQFQREFVWDKPRVITLFESIYNEYPIGSFFFWDAPQNYHNFYRDIAELKLPKPDKYDKLAFILDGQQRITSLYVTVKGLTLYGRNYKEICFDLDDKKFVDKKPDNLRYISISDLLSDDKPDIYDNLTSDRKNAFKECYRKFINYPFSAIDVRDKELDEVCEIFERINQGGQKLNLFDLIAASTWTPDFDLRKVVKSENENLKNKGFGEIDNEVYTQTLSLISRSSCTRVVQLQLTSSDVQQHWQDTIDSMHLAVDYLRNNLGVVNSLFPPYRSMIAVVAYLFYKSGRSLNHQQAEFLNQWFWQTTFSERYSASTLTLMTEDRKLMDKIADGREVTIHYQFDISIDSLMDLRMYRKSTIKNGILCLLAKKNPLHFKNNSPLPLRDVYFSDFNNAERHHIFPKSIVQKSYPAIKVHSLPNFCFIPAELNKEISNKKPSKYFDEFSQENPDFADTLKTHFISYDDSIKRDDFVSFLSSRAAMMLEEITKVTGSKTSKIVADDANKAIDKTERQLRDLIDRKLRELDQKYWKSKIPSDIVGVTRDRINDYLKKDPSKNLNDLTSREILDFCDIMDYSKIVLLNWDIFSPLFRSKTEVEKKFLNLNEYRKIVKHNRGEVVSFIKKEGEAAIEWLSIILSSVNNKENNVKPQPESDELIAQRATSSFVQASIFRIPKWVSEEFKEGIVAHKRWAGSGRTLTINKNFALFYVSRDSYIYTLLEHTKPEELKILKEKLSRPEKIFEKARNKSVSFQMTNENDLKIVQDIIRNRAKND